MGAGAVKGADAGCGSKLFHGTSLCFHRASPCHANFSVIPVEYTGNMTIMLGQQPLTGCCGSDIDDLQTLFATARPDQSLTDLIIINLTEVFETEHHSCFLLGLCGLTPHVPSSPATAVGTGMALDHKTPLLPETGQGKEVAKPTTATERHDLPLPDRTRGEQLRTRAMQAKLVEKLRLIQDHAGNDQGVYIHCKAGVGRTGIFAVLLLCVLCDKEPDAALDIVKAARQTVTLKSDRDKTGNYQDKRMTVIADIYENLRAAVLPAANGAGAAAAGTGEAKPDASSTYPI